MARGRTLCEWGIQALSFPHAPFFHQRSLIKHEFKGKIIKNFMMMTAEHLTPSVGVPLKMEPRTEHRGCKPMNLVGPV